MLVNKEQIHITLLITLLFNKNLLHTSVIVLDIQCMFMKQRPTSKELLVGFKAHARVLVGGVVLWNSRKNHGLRSPASGKALVGLPTAPCLIQRPADDLEKAMEGVLSA